VPLQVARWTGKRAGLAVTDTAQTLIIPAGSIVIEISAVENCYIRFGTDSVTAADNTIGDDVSRLFLSGMQVVPVPIDATTDAPYNRISVIRATTNGIFQVEKVE